jgi:hypothetical protein
MPVTAVLHGQARRTAFIIASGFPETAVAAPLPVAAIVRNRRGTQGSPGSPADNGAFATSHLIAYRCAQGSPQCPAQGRIDSVVTGLGQTGMQSKQGDDEQWPKDF